MELPVYFEALMNRAPIVTTDVVTFLREMRRTPQGPLITSKLIATKIQSPSEAQAIHAFEFLEAALECETEGSIEFRTEIGRYRFLNEIIRILSPKYLGDQTPEPVKERAKKFLVDAAGVKKPKWFPSEHSKIVCVYNSLIDTGIMQKPVEDDGGIDPAEAELQKSIFDRAENAVMLKKLLTSKDPADLQAANRLIKNLVDEEAKRNERRAELHSLIDRIETSTSLLTEMLSQPSVDQELVGDLVTTCKNLRQKLAACATETADETTSVLQASENIEKALQLFEDRKSNLFAAPLSNSSGSTGGSQKQQEQPTADTPLSLVDELLIGLSEEFAAAAAIPSVASKYNEDLLLNLDVEIKDGRGDGSHVTNNQNADPTGKPTKGADTLDEIERLSREMMEQSLKNSGFPTSVATKKTEKATLSQLQKNSSLDKTNNGTIPANATLIESTHSFESSAMNFLDLDFLEKPKSVTTNNNSTTGAQLNSKPKKSPRGSTSNEDDLLLTLETQNTPSFKEATARTSNENLNFNLNSVKEVDLEKIDLCENVKPIELGLLDDEGGSCSDVAVTVTMGKVPEFPESVLVAIVTLANKSQTAGLLNYVFQLAPPKGMQVKLLPPSRLELPPWKKTFLPPPVLTQVALLFSNQKTFSVNKTKLKFILSYCLGEEDTALFNGHFELPQIRSQ